jgi:hypothetical protein
MMKVPKSHQVLLLSQDRTDRTCELETSYAYTCSALIGQDDIWTQKGVVGGRLKEIDLGVEKGDQRREFEHVFAARLIMK